MACAVLVSIGCGSGKTNLRLANAMPTEPSLAMLVGGNNVASGVAYGSASGYTSVGSGSQNVQIEATGGTQLIINQSVTLNSTTNNTFLATSSGSMVLADDNTAPPAGDVAIRAVNASATLNPADIYIVPSGTNIFNVNPTQASVAFPAATSYQTVAAGTYQVIFTSPGSKIPMISSSPLTFTAGQIRTVLGLDGENGGFTTGVLADLD